MGGFCNQHLHPSPSQPGLEARAGSSLHGWGSEPGAQPAYRPSSRRSWGRERPDNRRRAWRGAPRSRLGCVAPARGTLEGLSKNRAEVRRAGSWGLDGKEAPGRGRGGGRLCPGPIQGSTALPLGLRASPDRRSGEGPQPSPARETLTPDIEVVVLL